jgi:hypothetical protein
METKSIFIITYPQTSCTQTSILAISLPSLFASSTAKDTIKSKSSSSPRVTISPSSSLILTLNPLLPASGFFASSSVVDVDVVDSVDVDSVDVDSVDVDSVDANGDVDSVDANVDVPVSRPSFLRIKDIKTAKVVEGVMRMYRVSDAANTLTRILQMAVAGRGGGVLVVVVMGAVVVFAVQVVGKGVIS